MNANKIYADAKALCYGAAMEAAKPFERKQLSDFTVVERLMIDRIAEWMGSRDCEIEQLRSQRAAGRYFIEIPEGKPCENCGQPEGVKLHVSRGGYGVTSGHEHKPDCPTLFCPHGALWSDDCTDCEAIKLAEGTDDTCGPCCSGVHEKCEGSGCICDHAGAEAKS